ncbi:hypothetical protein B0H16DRAFT_1459845 [Mycena metata]|uniref:Uncharacterized protein n=1 Tax=Mycena metata TaxID=1033252 RepID=A0AAD7IXS0_9AGAR|nr:hypothetical protein B0H16DRAFT_1459845 [Mycena metata]
MSSLVAGDISIWPSTPQALNFFLETNVKSPWPRDFNSGGRVWSLIQVDPDGGTWIKCLTVTDIEGYRRLLGAHARATRGYQPLAGSYQEPNMGGLAYQATRSTETS